MKGKRVKRIKHAKPKEAAQFHLKKEIREVTVKSHKLLRDITDKSKSVKKNNEEK